MDPSASAAQDVQNQNVSNQPPVQNVVQDQAQQPTASVAAPTKAPVTISVNKEAGPAVIVAESPDTDNEDEEEVKVAQQEVVSQPGGGDGSVEEVEVQPAVPEFSPSQEVEPFVEKSPDQEKPDLPKVVRDAGVTVSGPGVIDVKENSFGVKKLPVTYEQAVVEEKVTKLHDSKHWLMGTIMYIWRKLNPNIGKKKVESTNEEVKS